MKRDPIDALGARLFEVARQERPRDGAIQRAVVAAQRERAATARWRLPSGTVATIGLAAAALAAGAVLFVGRDDSGGRISAEPASSMLRERVPQPSFSSAERPVLAPSAPEIERAAPSAAKVIVPPAHSAAQARTAPVTLTDELGALKLASSALGSGDAHAALAALDQYDRMKGDKKMRAEATLLRVEALSRTGQAAAASALAKQFVDQNPESPLVDRARSFVQ
jgi:hypothetical protein